MRASTRAATRVKQWAGCVLKQQTVTPNSPLPLPTWWLTSVNRKHVVGAAPSPSACSRSRPPSPGEAHTLLRTSATLEDMPSNAATLEYTQEQCAEVEPL